MFCFIHNRWTDRVTSIILELLSQLKPPFQTQVVATRLLALWTVLCIGSRSSQFILHHRAVRILSDIQWRTNNIGHSVTVTYNKRNYCEQVSRSSSWDPRLASTPPLVQRPLWLRFTLNCEGGNKGFRDPETEEGIKNKNGHYGGGGGDTWPNGPDNQTPVGLWTPNWTDPSLRIVKS